MAQPNPGNPPDVMAMLATLAGHAVQMNQVIMGGQSRSTLKEYLEPDPVTWKNWMTAFHMARRIDHWSHQRARQELRKAMSGRAAEIINIVPINDDIPPGDQDAADVQELLDLYTAKLIPPAAIKVAKEEWKMAFQGENERLVDWHARCRNLYTRAHPDKTPDEVEAESDLKDAFCVGMKNKRTYRKVWSSLNIADYSTAYTRASEIEVAEMLFNSQVKRTAVNSSHIFAMNAMDTRGPLADQRPPLLCHYCHKPGHFIRECYERQMADKQSMPRNFRQDPRSRFPDNRRTSGRNFQRPKPYDRNQSQARRDWKGANRNGGSGNRGPDLRHQINALMGEDSGDGNPQYPAVLGPEEQGNE